MVIPSTLSGQQASATSRLPWPIAVAAWAAFYFATTLLTLSHGLTASDLPLVWFASGTALGAVWTSHGVARLAMVLVLSATWIPIAARCRDRASSSC